MPSNHKWGQFDLDIPVSVAEAEATETLTVGPAPVPVVLPVQDAVFGEACAALQNARNPVAITGVDAVNELAGPSITAFCEAHNVPVIATYKAKGLLDEDHPLAIGGAGLSPKADKIVMPLLEKSDCILLIGYDPIEMRIGWRNPWGTDKAVIEITPILRTHRHASCEPHDPWLDHSHT